MNKWYTRSDDGFYCIMDLVQLLHVTNQDFVDYVKQYEEYKIVSLHELGNGYITMLIRFNQSLIAMEYNPISKAANRVFLSDSQLEEAGFIRSES